MITFKKIAVGFLLVAATTALAANPPLPFSIEFVSPRALRIRMKLSTLGITTKLKNLVTGEMLTGKLPPPRGWTWQTQTVEDRVSFTVPLQPHSYAVFALEGERGTANR